MKDTILQDAEAAAYNPNHNTAGLQREVVRYDAAGRKIIEFVGPIDAPNGMFGGRFAAPVKRVKNGMQGIADRVDHFERMAALRGEKLR
jgi:hypothetical protein